MDRIFRYPKIGQMENKLFSQEVYLILKGHEIHTKHLTTIINKLFQNIVYNFIDCQPSSLLEPSSGSWLVTSPYFSDYVHMYHWYTASSSLELP